MKRTILAAALAAASAAFAGTKIGTVDMQLLLRNHSAYDRNKELLLSTEKDQRKQLEGMRDELEQIQEEGRKLADDLKSPMLAQTAKEKSERELAGVQRRFVQLQAKMRDEAVRGQQQLADLEAKLIKAQAKDLKKIVSDFAKANGYDLVIDGTAAVYCADGYDVTDEVLKSMGVDPKAAREKAKDEGK